MLVFFLVAPHSLTPMQAVTAGPEEAFRPWELCCSGRHRDAGGGTEGTHRLKGYRPSFSVSWYANSGACTGIVVEYKEMPLAAESPAETLLPREPLSAVIEGPQVNASYKIKVYGLAGG